MHRLSIQYLIIRHLPTIRANKHHLQHSRTRMITKSTIHNVKQNRTDTHSGIGSSRRSMYIHTYIPTHPPAQASSPSLTIYNPRIFRDFSISEHPSKQNSILQAKYHDKYQDKTGQDSPVASSLSLSQPTSGEIMYISNHIPQTTSHSSTANQAWTDGRQIRFYLSACSAEEHDSLPHPSYSIHRRLTESSIHPSIPQFTHSLTQHSPSRSTHPKETKKQRNKQLKTRTRPDQTKHQATLPSSKALMMLMMSTNTLCE